MRLTKILKNLALCIMFLSPFSLHSIGTNSSQYMVIEDEAKIPLLSPTFSERKVLKIKLKNGLQAYLVSDPKIDKSGAVLSVEVGSWDNPPEFPGLAHFLEHLLFLGTKKYPKEAEYHRYILEHGGIANAYTDSDHTSYMFSIENNAFEEALDRFSNFFKEPLFNPSGVARELQAVDQEHNKNLINDDWLLYYIQKDLSSTDHPFHAFATGNISTLSNVNQDFLKKWYQEHYSANLMHLVVYSNLPLNELTDHVIDNFKDIPNHDRKAFTVDKPIATDQSEGHMVYVEALKNKRTLHMIWDMPSNFAKMRESKPEQLIGYVLAHEGKESLLEELKKEKLGDAIQFSGSLIGKNNLELDLTIELTDKGVDQVDEVIAKVFQTIALLKEKTYPTYLFEEIKKMAELNYSYQHREEVFNKVRKEGSLILNEDLSTYPEKTYIIQKFDPEAVKKLLNLMTPENTQFYLQAPSSLTGVKPEKEERWLGGKYAVKAIDKNKLNLWAKIKPNSNIDLPEPNELIPRELFLVEKEDLIQEDNPFIPVPEEILNNDKGQVYYSSDSYYLVPQVSWIFHLKSPNIELGNANKTVMTELYLKSLKNELNKYSYLSNLAGIHYQINRKENGVEIAINGYSEKAQLLFDKIIEQLKKVNPSEEDFNNYKNALLRAYENSAKNMPYEQAMEVLKSLIIKKFNTDEEKAEALKKVTYEKFLHFSQKIFSQVYLESVLYGNMKKSDAEELISKLFATLNAKPYPKANQKKPEVISLPLNGPFYLLETIDTPGNAVILAIEYGKYDFKLRAAQQILMQAMRESFFSTLRTKQQTGYIVKSGAEDIESQLFNIFIVQSSTHECRDLLSRFELFIEGYLQELTKDEITPERFDSIRDSLVEALEQPPKNMKEMSDVLNLLAFKYDGDFGWLNHRIQAFKDLTYNEFVEITNRYMGKQNKKRLGILLEGPSENVSGLRYTPLKKNNFKKSGVFISFGEGYKSISAKKI